jgi:hypothetical protein
MAEDATPDSDRASTPEAEYRERMESTPEAEYRERMDWSTRSVKAGRDVCEEQ